MNINEENLGEKLSHFESGLLNEEEVIELFQYLINKGYAWNLQEFYASIAISLIESGYCTFGENRTKGYWGQTIPSKYDLKPNTMGTDGFVQKRKELNDEDFYNFLIQIEKENKLND